MKKVILILVMGLLWCNVFMTTKLYSHPIDKHSFLECTFYNSPNINIEINQKKKEVITNPHNSKKKYKISEITENWISTEKENQRINIHRYLLIYIIDILEDDKWEESVREKCDVYKRKI